MSLRDVAESASDAVVKRVGRAYGRLQERSGLQYDLLESDEEVLVVFDAPGVNASDVQVSFTDDLVQVRIDRFRPFHEGFEMRFPGRGLALDGEAELPDDITVDPDAAVASLTDRGTLEVRLPKVSTTTADDSGGDGT